MNARPLGHPVRKARHAEAGFRLARLFGVEIRLDWSLLIIFALVTINLGAGVLPSWHPSWGPVGVWVGAAIAAVTLFASLLAHELSHALVARTQGVEVRRITLFLFGGVAHLEGAPPSPRAEFLIAVIGPLVSFAIGFTLTALGLFLSRPELASTQDFDDTLAVFRAMGPGVTLMLWLGPVNVMLGLFNLVPGYPLDGGRVLRSALWAVTRDQLKATRWASFVGQVIAWTVMAFGLLRVIRGDLMGGLWFALIGWFLFGAARAGFQEQLVRRTLEHVPVSRIMRTRLERVGPGMLLEELIRDHVMADDQRAWPVESDGQLLGLVTFDDLRKVPYEEWERRTVADVMTPARSLASITPEAGAEVALQELSQRQLDQLPVLDQEQHLLGLVRRQDLVRWMALRANA